MNVTRILEIKVIHVNAILVIIKIKMMNVSVKNRIILKKIKK
jgi:hypothetical protein